MIVLRGGHNRQATGASGLIDEVEEDRKVTSSAIKWLRIAGEEVIDATPSRCTSSVDLAYGVNIANKEKADLFLSIHFNNAYPEYKKPLGTETLCNLNNKESVEISERITNNLVSLGFKDRGVRDGLSPRRLYEIRKTNMNAIIVEVCFVESVEDVGVYKEVGYDLVGKKIAEGIIGREIKQENDDQKYIKELENKVVELKKQVNDRDEYINKIGRGCGEMLSFVKSISQKSSDLLSRVNKLN